MRASKLPARVALYGLLLLGALVFSWPLLWMAATSVKADRHPGAASLRIGSITARSSALEEDVFPAGDDSRTDSRMITTRFPIERLETLRVAIGSDDSWSSLETTVEMAGTRYRATRTYDLIGVGTRLVTFQVTGDREGPGVLSLVPEDRSPRYEYGERGVRITLTLRRNGPLRAWWVKVRRNYLEVFDRIPFWRYFSTSVLLVISNTGGTLLSCSLVAYSFARLRWRGRSLCFLLMLATMMVPPQVTMVPQFLLVKHLGWYDTLLPLWVPSLFAAAFHVFLLRQFLLGVPRELEEAARIDGCGFWRVYWHLMLPAARPVLAVIAAFTFLDTWNDFLGPLIYIADQRLFPLSLGIYALNVDIGGPNTTGVMMAASLLMTLPVIVAFLVAQRYFLGAAANAAR